MRQRIYLDNNASTALDPRIIALLTEWMPKIQGNPSSVHSFGREARGWINQAREQIARTLGVRASEILFTSSGTESAHLAMEGLLANHTSGHIITSEAEHACVHGKAKQLQKQGFEVTFLKPTAEGFIDPEDLAKAVQPDTRLIALLSVNNETGVKNDVEAFAAVAEKHQIPLFVDAVAALGKEPIAIPKGVLAMGFSGHKIHVPAGIGCLYVHPRAKIKGARPGTENLLGILALGKGFELISEELPAWIKKMEALRNRFEETLCRALPGVVVNGQGARVANVSNLQFGGMDGESLLIALDQEGIAASHGSACSSGALEPSRVLLSMGLSLQAARSSVRFSFSHFTTEQEIDRACERMIAIVKKGQGS